VTYTHSTQVFGIDRWPKSSTATQAIMVLHTSLCMEEYNKVTHFMYESKHVEDFTQGNVILNTNKQKSINTITNSVIDCNLLDTATVYMLEIVGAIFLEKCPIIQDTIPVYGIVGDDLERLRFSPESKLIILSGIPNLIAQHYLSL
ncbi:hypothetical protein ACJX0J_034818, partial [Zea mays]